MIEFFLPDLCVAIYSYPGIISNAMNQQMMGWSCEFKMFILTLVDHLWVSAINYDQNIPVVLTCLGGIRTMKKFIEKAARGSGLPARSILWPTQITVWPTLLNFWSLLAALNDWSLTPVNDQTKSHPYISKSHSYYIRVKI